MRLEHFSIGCLALGAGFANVGAGPLSGAPPSGPRPEASVFERWEESGYGLISGRVQGLAMHRDIDDAAEGGSATLAATLNYRSPERGGFHLGAQYLYSWLLWEEESAVVPHTGYWLANDEFGVLNEAYLGYDLGSIGWEGAQLKVGRQVLNYDFAPTYNIRQKDQSYEGIVLTTRPAANLSVDVGWLHRFSSWASRDGGPSTWRADFIDVEDRVGVPYDSRGMFFASASYQPVKALSLNAYDFYGDDMFNVFGVKGAYAWAPGGGRGGVTLRGHWAQQRDVGRMSRDGLGDIGSNVAEVGIDYTCGGLTLSGGGVFIRGDDFQTPFRTSFTIDTELLWYTMQFEGGTNSGYLKGVWKWEDWMFYAMYVASEHRCGRVCQEIDVVVKKDFGKHFYTAVKAGYGGRVMPASLGGGKTEAFDLRWFVGCTF